MLSVFSDPDCMLVVSGVLLSGIESLISFSVLEGLSKITFSISKSFDCVVSQFGISTHLSEVIIDVCIEVEKDLRVRGFYCVILTLSQAAKSVLLTLS